MGSVLDIGPWLAKPFSGPELPCGHHLLLRAYAELLDLLEDNQQVLIQGTSQGQNEVSLGTQISRIPENEFIRKVGLTPPKLG